MVRNTSTRKFCLSCSKRAYANIVVIHCSHCSRLIHLKCLKKLKSTIEINEINSFSKDYLCHNCIVDALPFLHLNDVEFHTALFELQNGYSPFCNSERLNALPFHPFRDDSLRKSKANFIDNFCDPDERVFTKIDHD